MLTFLSFLAIVTLYMMRVCLYISMTQMVKPIVSSNETIVQDELSCPAALEEIAEPRKNSTLMSLAHEEPEVSCRDFEIEKQNLKR